MTHRHFQPRSLPPQSDARRPFAQALDVLFAAPVQRSELSTGGTRRISAPAGARALTLEPSSWDATTRTIDVVWTTGARCPLYMPEIGLVEEELITGAANVRLGRLNSGAPVLNSHNKFDVGNQIGVVVPGSVRLADGRGVATLRLSERDDLAPIVNDIASGIIRNISVGYHRHVVEVDLTTDPPFCRTIDWEPTEISFVAVPADAGAQTRSAAETHPCIVRTAAPKEHRKMNTSWLSRFTGTHARTGSLPPGVTPDGIRHRMPAGDEDDAEPSYDRKVSIGYIREYLAMAQRSFGLPQHLCAELALELAERNLTEGEVRDAVVHIAGQRQRQQTGGLANGGSAVGSPAGNALIFGERTFDNPEFHTRAIEDALFARMSGKPPTEAAREFMGMTMVQIATDLLTRSGISNANRMAPNDILSAAAWNSGGGRSYMHQRSFDVGYHTTSDFPQLMLGAGQRYLLEVFAYASSPLKLISRERSARDFREISGIQLSGFGTLEEVPESGEIKHGTFRARAETYRLRTFAKQFALSRQAIINDDLAAFSDPMTIMARAAAETEASLFADLLNSNPVMADGIPLFDVRHGNVAAVGSAPAVDTIDAGRQSMRAQKDLDGVTPLAGVPKYLVVGSALETTADTLAGTANVLDPTGKILIPNPFAGKLTSAVDPRLAAKPWYLFGDPAIAPMLEHAYLNGKNGPNVEQKDGWDVLGTSFRVYMDFGAGAVDWRGGYKNPGANG